MAPFQTTQQHDFSGKITTSNRQFVNDQADAARPNHPVQMTSANPFATTMENPWLGMKQMLPGSDNMVIQQQDNPMISAYSTGPPNMLPNDQRKQSRVSTENQLFNNQDYLIPDYAPQNIKDDMIMLRETDHMLCQQSKMVRMQFAEKQNQAVQHLVESVRIPFLEILEEKDEKIVDMEFQITNFRELEKLFSHVKKAYEEHAMACEIKAMTMRNKLDVALAKIMRLQGLVQPNVAAKAEQEKVQTGAAETEEGSGDKKMCKICGQMELSVLALPCRHLCFCIVCGMCESCLYCVCPVCHSPITATVPVSYL